MIRGCPRLFVLILIFAQIGKADEARVPASAAPTAGDGAAVYRDPYRYKGHVTPLPPAPESATPVAEPEKWDHWLPFYAQRIIDRGIELPPPYDVGYSYVYGYQRLRMRHLQASIGDNSVRPLDFVHFDTSKIYTQSNQFQLGAWLFPFLNIYGIFGNIRGHGGVNITFSTADGLERMPGGEMLGDVSIPTQRADYSGATYGAGFTLVGHYKKLFVSIPFTYLAADVSMSDSLSRTINIGPRAGTTLGLGRFGALIAYAGATYFHLNADITGHFDIPIENRPGETFRFNYAITEKASGAWSGFFGASWMINRTFNIILEKGYGYNRANIIATVFYRF